ncbi:lysylphosphatidylglycerol synthase domain-containing protein [Aquisphaera giovannonii]|uniref:lysylphosphatidylglycerol synthase domain-containing protein n=1 Tax=Aquisphaera giovannonii TaxID=406548 RepID=UPI00143D35FD|nr:lysylphosphatidylglycerol synthase domain-containing protein [Aquisphaera giovannonii]
MKHLRSSPKLRRLAVPLAATAIAVGMARGLAGQGDSFFQAVTRVGIAGLGVALAASVVHRVVNAAGWVLVVRSLGQRMDASVGVRVWLASEACRWLPGSVWSYGSRTFLAARLGMNPGTAAASLVLELLVTVCGWVMVAALGWPYLGVSLGAIAARLPAWDDRRLVACEVGLGVSLVLLAAIAAGSGRVRARSARLMSQLVELRRRSASLPRLAVAAGYFAAMGVFSGLIFLAVLRATPDGAAVPAGAAIAANALAWLVGFFAIFAPGGLGVREACLVAMLSPWMPAEEAFVLSLAWRLVQVAAEMLCFVAVAAWGLPGSIAAAPPPREPGTRRGPSRPARSGLRAS